MRCDPADSESGEALVKRFWEWYLQLPAAPAGEGTEWRWDWRWPWPENWSAGVAAAALLVVIGYVVWIYRRDAAQRSWWERLAFVALRLSVLLTLAGLLTEVSLVVIRTGLPSCVVLIDTSASMSLPGQASTSTATVGASGPSRLSLAQELLTARDGEFLKQVSRQYRLQFYQFSDTASPLAQAEVSDPEELQQALAEIVQLRASGHQTRPAPAVCKVLSDLRGNRPSSIIVLTDGVASLSESEQLSHAATWARQQGVQLYAVGLGSDEGNRDVQLDDFVVDEIAFVGDPILMTARLRTFGMSGEALTVQLRDVADHRVIAQQQAVAGADGDPLKVELLYTPEAAGEFDYRLEIGLQPRETNPDNNSQTRHVQVREEKIRVLLADSAPRYEFRYLKQLLERDKSVELKTLLQEADLEYAQEDKTAISHFPVRRDELAQFDVLILGDIAAASVPEGAWKEIVELVRTKGTGVIFIAGTRHPYSEFSGSALANLLPFEVGEAKSAVARERARDGFRPSLTLEGRKGSHLFRLADTEEESVSIWNQLPEFYWFLEIARTKPGVAVFATFPQKGDDKGSLPLILVERIGAGKVLFHAIEETWRWRFRSGDAYFGRYWIQAIRYLSRSRMIGKDRPAELTTDRLTYEQGEPVQFRARFQEDRFAPAPGDQVILTLERQGGQRQTVSLSRVPQAPTVYEGQAASLPEGSYHVWITSPAPGPTPTTTDFRVELPVRELQQRTLNRADLETACRQSNGKYYAWSDAGKLPEELPAGTPVRLESDQPIPLWNRSELLCLLGGLLTVEWWFRKRCRLV